MAEPGSVTHWIRQLQDGDTGRAQQELWNRYFDRLLSHAQRRLSGVSKAVADEEDAVAIAFQSFFRRAKQGEYPSLKDRSGLWPLLVTITARRAINLRRQAIADARHVRDEGHFFDTLLAGIELVTGNLPSPEFALETAEEVRRLLEILKDPSLETVAVLKLQGYRNHEIATGMQVIERTVERRLAKIRRIWEKHLQA